MFLGLVALTGLILALVSRRPLGRLLTQHFRRIALLWLGAGLHVLFVPPALNPILSTSPVPGLPPVGGMLYVASLALLLAFAWSNRHNVGIAVIGLGLLMNAAVITANGGQMPVDAGQLAAKGQLQEMVDLEQAGMWSSFAVSNEDTRLFFLGDRLLMPRPVIEPVVLSLGDFVIAAGILLFLLVIPESDVSGPMRLPRS